MNIRSIVALFCLLASGGLALGQDTHDCINPKPIDVPFNEQHLNSDEEIYYSSEDRYTYWYKFSMNEIGELQYDVTSLKKGDEFEVLLYPYNGENFCNELVKSRIPPTLIGAKGKIKGQIGAVYYMAVIHLYGDGCGHNLALNFNGNYKEVKAIQNDCVEDVMADLKPIEVKLDTITEIDEVVVNIKKEETVVDGIQVKVINAITKQRIDAELVVLKNQKQTESISIKSSNNRILDKSYYGSEISIKKLGYKAYKSVVDSTANELLIALTPIEKGEKLVLRRIYFHPNTYVLKEESKGELQQLSQFMLENSEYKFEIQGHTNGNRSIKKNDRYAHLGEEWNFKGTSKKLSKLRAEKIKNYLIEKGVLEDQLSTIGYGGDKMIINKPKNMQQAMKNIRVEVMVIQ